MNMVWVHGGRFNREIKIVGVDLSPTTIITGHTIYFSVHCKLDFGVYAQVHE